MRRVLKPYKATPILLLLAVPVVSLSPPEELQIQLVKSDEARIDVLAGEQPFTSYYYGLGFAKPIFHPLRSPRGHRITRGYPIEFGISGERRDHWHHESLWFTYGNVNGVDFWAIRGAEGDTEASGKIRHTGISRLEDGTPGCLEVTADWVAPDGNVLLKQRTLAAFRASSDQRAIDLTVELSPAGQAVTFHDTKEGMLGIRVAPALREDQTGRYLDAQGREKESGVWGKRSPWVALRGTVEDEALTLAVFNHPQSTGFPTYWHARGYGLFAANPFGRKDFEPGSTPIEFRLQPGESVHFRYLILIHSGQLGSPELAAEFQSFVQQP